VIVPIHEGDLFDARFRVLSLLGRGGMGEVWSAVDELEGGRVAVKVLLEKAARKPDLVARFEREALIVASIESPYICRLLHSGRGPSGEPYLVLEYLEGESLADRLKRDPEYPCPELIPLIDNVLEGLIEAHAKGVIHRDLKPANIFLVGQRERAQKAMILDFGISKILKRNANPGGLRRAEASLTTFDATLGSFAYMAPEQVRGAARADERADIYAVGAVVFRALTGRLPFEGVTATMLLSSKLGTDAPSLSETTGERWPRAIEHFISLALARHREARFASAQDALTAWRDIGTRYYRAFSKGRALTEEPRGPSNFGILA
jgi:serine/threonine-protein kinase